MNDQTKTVSFTRMDEGTPEDYAFLGKLEHEYVTTLPDRLLGALEGLRNSLAGYKIDRLEHSLQSATRAEADGAERRHNGRRRRRGRRRARRRGAAPRAAATRTRARSRRLPP